jgi:hypothetical protein
MKLGNKIFIYFIFLIYPYNLLIADDKIINSPLIDLQKIKPSFDEINEENKRSYFISNESKCTRFNDGSAIRGR